MPSLLEIVLSNAAIATVLALAALAMGRYCRRPAVVHAIWLLVLLKFLTPAVWRVPLPSVGQQSAVQPAGASIASPLERSASWNRSIGTIDFTLRDRISSPGTASQIEMGIDKTESPAKALCTRPAGGDTDSAYPSATNLAEIERLDPSIRRPASTSVAASGVALPAIRRIPWLELTLAVWLAGSLGWFCVTFVRLLRFSRESLRDWPNDAPLQRQAEVLARRFGMSRAPVVRLVDARLPPMLWAMRRPVTIFLPRELATRLSPQQQLTLLAHELAHYHRRDHWVRWLEVFVLGIYWWHPVAWLTRRELHRAEEQCCDAWVLWAFPEAGVAYADAILETVDFLTAAYGPTPALASGLSPVHLLERRFEMILHGPTKRRLNALAKWTLVLFGLVVLPLSASGQVAPAASGNATERDAPPTTTPPPAQPAVTIEIEPVAGSPPGAETTKVGGPAGQSITPVLAASQPAAQNDTEHRLQRVEKMLESILAETKHQKTASADAEGQQFAKNKPGKSAISTRKLLERGQANYVSLELVGKVPTLSDMKKQRIDVEDELERLQQKLADIDKQIAKMKGADPASDTNGNILNRR